MIVFMINFKGVLIMNDKSIRKILISYIQAANNEVRIYQKQQIGGSIWEVRGVSGHGGAWVVKCDLDKYQRLEAQIKAYNLFFR